MKKNNLRYMMLKGTTIGLLLSHQTLKGEDEDKANSDFLQLVENTKGNIAFRPLTEDDLLLELNQESADLYKSLSPEGQQLALKLASRSCNGLNDCKGENACQTKDNKCAGQGKCRGLTKCAFSDKNYAVKVAVKLMAEKRQGLQKPSSPSS
jgi:hypothetical protein